MTDRYKGFIVALKNDMRDDDAQRVIEAIEMIQGVLSVKPLISTSEDGIAEMRAKQELLSKIYDLFKY